MGLITKLLFFLLPLLFWPSPFKFELIKIVFFLGGSFLLVFQLLIRIKKGDFEKHWQKINKNWFFWVGILLISTLLNQKIPFGLLTGGYRHQGAIFFLLLGLLIVIIKTLDQKTRRDIFSWATIAILIETFIVWFQWLAIKVNLPILSYNQRPIGTLGEPSAVAGFLILGLPILAYSLHQPVILSISLLATVVAIFLTGSKAGILALLAELLVFYFFWKKGLPFKKLLLGFSLILFVSVGIIGVWQEKGKSPFEDRWLIWKLGIEAIKEKPLFGYGAEGIISVYETQYQKIDRTLEGMIVERSHNLFLDVILFSGLVGLVFFSRWLGQISQEIIKKKPWKIVPLVGFLVFSFFQPLEVTHWLYFILLIS